jgi:hypothetical protein
MVLVLKKMAKNRKKALDIIHTDIGFLRKLITGEPYLASSEAEPVARVCSELRVISGVMRR